jgi:hypothetical protein
MLGACCLAPAICPSVPLLPLLEPTRRTDASLLTSYAHRAPSAPPQQYPSQHLRITFAFATTDPSRHVQEAQTQLQGTYRIWQSPVSHTGHPARSSECVSTHADIASCCSLGYTFPPPATDRHVKPPSVVNVHCTGACCHIIPTWQHHAQVCSRRQYTPYQQ